MPLDTTRSPAAASPLWIIALFIALSEVTTGAAAVGTAGPARLIFACFAVAFPIAVFTVFVWLLIRYPQNLYAPGQYSKEITPEIYRSAMRSDERRVFARAVAEASLSEAVGDTARNAEVARRVRSFELAVENSSVAVSVDAIAPDAEDMQIPVTETTTVDSFLDSVYFSLRPAVEPYAYNRTWTLVNDKGAAYSDIGAEWARHQGLGRDSRLLNEVGIEPGGHVSVRPLDQTSRRRQTANP